MKQLSDIITETTAISEPTTTEKEIWSKQYKTNKDSIKLYDFILTELKNKNAQITYYVTLIILCDFYDTKFVMNNNPNSRNIGYNICKLANVKPTTKNIYFALNNIIGFRDKLESVLEKTYDTQNFFDDNKIN